MSDQENALDYLQPYRLIHLLNNGVAQPEIVSCDYITHDSKKCTYTALDRKTLGRHIGEEHHTEAYKLWGRSDRIIIDKSAPQYECGFYLVNKEHCVVGDHCAVCGVQV